ncbi:MAG: lamin tail domain-containing protein [Tannerella sp.]|jgi:Na+-transporting methylmalonyl-CoA/oxaloacetate decarboxylase gamma subunit|nr:lamin tail domain-containing protein [Tannerella sp.]
MNIRRKGTGIALLLICCCASFVQGQRTANVRFNEVLVINEDNFVDDYGVRNGWIELYNNSPGTVNIGGCYLTNNREKREMYMIPKGDVLTKIPPRQHVLFWADNKPSRGTFHLSFTLDPNRENYLALYEADGKTLIDTITIPAGQRPNVSYGLVEDGSGPWKTLANVTPSSNNKILDTNDKIRNFQDKDAWGAGMTLTAMSVVFIGLMLLFLSFKYIGKTAVKASRRRSKQSGGDGKHDQEPASGEVFAAIAAALHEVEEDVHDFENTVLTIRKVARNYSPWNSKIYGLREPLKK